MKAISKDQVIAAAKEIIFTNLYVLFGDKDFNVNGGQKTFYQRQRLLSKSYSCKPSILILLNIQQILR